MKRKLMVCWTALVFAVILCSVSIVMAASSTTLSPTIDTWIRESAPDTSYDNDRVCVWLPPTDAPGDTRCGILQFDVSGMTEPITAAYLDLYLTSYWRNSSNSAVQVAELITSPVPSGNVTWNDITGGSYTTIPMETFGYYHQEAGLATGQYYASGVASAADLAAMNVQKNTTGTLTFLLKPLEPQIIGYETVTYQEGRHDWADIGYYSDTLGQAVPPTLLFNGRTAWAEATTDVWISEARDDAPAWANDGIFENDLISVWFNERESDGVGDGERVGIIEFDLSTVSGPITSAEMALYSIANSSVKNEAFIQEAYLLELAPGISLTDIDWTTFTDPTKITEIMKFESLGGYTLPGGEDNASYDDTWLFSNASTVDAAKLEEIRQTGGKAVIAFRAVAQEFEDQEVPIYDIGGGQREWSDTGYDSATPEIWPHLVLNESTVVDIPGDANRDGKVDGSDVTILAGNWQVLSGANWGMGDFNGDGKVDGSDVTILAGNWQAGVTASAASVPEPSTILLILSALAGLVFLRRK